MFDVFLDAHKLGPRLYSIGGKLTPVSLRDQMIRGEWFVKRAAETGLLSQDAPHPLLVVGAGAAGVAAAMHAAALGFETRLIDKASAGFAPQRQSTRRVCPTVYDFPTDHWTVRRFPLVRTNPTTLGWMSGRAGFLATDLWRQFQQYNQNQASLVFRAYTTLDARPTLDPSGQHLTAALTRSVPGTATTKRIEDFSLVLIATGPGREMTYLQDPPQPPSTSPTPSTTWGYPFWDNQRLEFPNFGVAASRTPEILISGSGDGAIQDFVRCVTCCAAADEVFDHLQRVRPLNSDEICRMHSAKARALRNWQWGRDARQDHEALEPLHQVHLDIVRNVLQSGGLALGQHLNQILRDPLPEITWIHECTHFSHCYCLNRFVGLLLGEFLNEFRAARGQNPVMINRRRLHNLHSYSLQHVCQGDPAQCHGELHQYDLVDAPQCGNGNFTVLPAERGLAANVLIIRHGVDRSQFSWDPTPSWSRHLLPFSP